MFKYLLLLFVFSNAYGFCQLDRQEELSRSFVGYFDLDQIREGSIRLPISLGDVSRSGSPFDFDYLYELKSGDRVSRFRFSDDFFSNGRTYLGGIAWEGGYRSLPAGVYSVHRLEVEPRLARVSMTIIGDSITWWSYGRNFRCLLSKHLPGVGFIGPHTDPFGHGHAGEGGNKTIDILKRLDQIDGADFYLLMAGTNDWAVLSAEQTVGNLKEISARLGEKGGRVLIATLLPRFDKHFDRNSKVNQLLREWGGSGCNCFIVDYEADFLSVPEAKSLFWDEGLHPSLDGYMAIVDILGPRLSRIVNAK